MREEQLVEAIFGGGAGEAELGTSRKGLRELARLREALDGLERSLVLAARAERASWAAIAADLGVARATALRRHRAADPVSLGRDARRAADPWLQELAAIRALTRGEAARPAD